MTPDGPAAPGATRRGALPPGTALLAVAAGGAIGAAARHALGLVVPDGAGFPWTTFAVNVGGSLLLGALPALAAARRSQGLALLLGPGLLGGFTTLSLHAEQTRSLAAGGSGGTALLYLAGTLLACLVAVLVAERVTTPAQRSRFEQEEGDL